MNDGPPRALAAQVRVLDAASAAMARAEARQVAKALGWAAEAVEELAICASELTMNIVDHAGASGTIAVVGDGAGAFIDLLAQDRGGAFDPARVGAPSAPGRGGGLPALGRLMDVTALTWTEEGLQVRCRRWTTARRRAPVRAAIVRRARPRERVCGDAALIERRGGVMRLAVVDGLGHGESAAVAAESCTRALAEALGLPLEAAVRRAHEALAGTRGAALAVVDVDEASGTGVAAVIGNCRVEVHGPGGPRSASGTGAVLGQPTRLPVRLELLELAGSSLVLSSDGVAAARSARPLAPVHDRVLPAACARFAAHAGSTDDATLLVAVIGPP